jgi:hypothetical protein
VAAPFFTLGASKAAEARLIDLMQGQFKKTGYRFHFASQVSASGGLPSGDDLSAEAHATAYWRLITQRTPERWDYRFTKDGSILNGGEY